ncbi:MAG: hypothetical protein JOZ02_17750 [Acidobacteria bacterium]|nr:hypothetical protein [Acidobacteriota bacterium]
MTTDKIAALRRTALFGELDDSTLGALAARAVERRYARDEIIFLAGGAGALLPPPRRGAGRVHAVVRRGRLRRF